MDRRMCLFPLQGQTIVRNDFIKGRGMGIRNDLLRYLWEVKLKNDGVCDQKTGSRGVKLLQTMAGAGGIMACHTSGLVHDVCSTMCWSTRINKRGEVVITLFRGMARKDW